MAYFFVGVWLRVSQFFPNSERLRSLQGEWFPGATPCKGDTCSAKFAEQKMEAPEPVLWPALGKGREQHERPQGDFQEER